MAMYWREQFYNFDRGVTASIGAGQRPLTSISWEMHREHITIPSWAREII